MADYVDNLILQVTGREQVDYLTKAIQAEEQALLKAIDTHGKHSQQARVQAQSLQALNDQLQQTQKLVATSTNNTKGYQQGLMAASYALQDFTSANGGFVQQLQSVNNNIPQILIGLGGPGMSAGMVAGISALTTGVIIAAPHLARLATTLDLFGTAANQVKGQVEQLQARVKELESMKIRPTVDTVELDNLKRQLRDLQTAEAAFNQFRNVKGEDEQRAGQETEQLLALAPGGARALAEKLRADRAKELLETDRTYLDLETKIAGEEDKIRDARMRAANLRQAGVPGAAGFAEREAQDAQKQREALRQQRDQRRLDLIGDNATGTVGQAERDIGAMFKGATGGNDPDARRRLVAQLRRVGQNDLANEIEATTPKAAGVARQEDVQDQHEQRGLDFNNFRRGLRDQRNQREARPVLEDAAKALNLAEEAAKGLKQIRDRGGVEDGNGGVKKLNAQEQLDYLRKQLQGFLEDELKAKGLLNPGSSAMAEAMARQIGSGARDQLDGKLKADKAAAEKARETPPEAAGKEAEQRNKALSQGLGDPFIAAAQQRLLAIGQLPAKDREKAMQAFQDQFTRAAGRRLMGGGMEAGQAADLAQGAVGFVKDDLGRQMGQMQGMAGGQLSNQQLRALLFQRLGQGQQQGGQGFRSVAPVAPGGGQQAQDGVQALAQVNGQIVQGHQQTNEALIRLAADTQRALARTQAQLAALARRQQQDGYSFLPETW